MAFLCKAATSPCLRTITRTPSVISRIRPLYYDHRTFTTSPPARRAAPSPIAEDSTGLKKNTSPPPSSSLGGTTRLPEFNLTGKVVLVSGAARGLGLVQAEALLEAGAIVYALDRLPEPSPDFFRVQKRAAEDLGTTLHYRQVDVRDVEGLNGVVRSISDAQGKMDGLIAAAGIQQETSALEYTAEDANTMFAVSWNEVGG